MAMHYSEKKFRHILANGGARAALRYAKQFPGTETYREVMAAIPAAAAQDPESATSRLHAAGAFQLKRPNPNY